MPIDPRHLTHLLAISTEGSFNRAAQLLGVSQPALSKSIQLLEARLGYSVMTRTARGSALTAAGEILVRRAEALKSLLGDAEEEVRLNASGGAGPLRIGATPSMMLELVPRTLTRLLGGRTKLALSVIEDLDGALLPALLKGQIDLLVGPVGGLYPKPPSVLEEALIDDPYGIGVANDHPLAGRGDITLAELTDAAWVLPLPGSLFHRHVEALFITADAPWPRDVVNTNSLALSERLVLEVGRIMTMTSLQLREVDESRIWQIRLLNGGSRAVGYSMRRDARPSPVAREFLDVLRMTAADYPGFCGKS